MDWSFWLMWFPTHSPEKRRMDGAPSGYKITRSKIQLELSEPRVEYVVQIGWIVLDGFAGELAGEDSLVFGEVFDRGFAVNAGEQEHGEQAGNAGLEGDGVKGVAGKLDIALPEGSAHLLKADLARRMIEALEQEMVEQEGEVEGGVAIPGYFAIEQDHARGRDHEVFGAEVAVDEAEARLGEPLGLGIEEGLQIGVALAGGDEVRVDAELDEVGSGGKGALGLGVASRVSVDGAEDGCGAEGVFNVDLAAEHLLLPTGEFGAEELHGEVAAIDGAGTQGGNGLGQDAGNVSDVELLVAVAAHVGEPLVFDAELGEGALDDEGVGAVVNAIDFAGDAVGEGREGRAGMAQEAVLAQGGEEVVRGRIVRGWRDDAGGLLKPMVGAIGAALAAPIWMLLVLRTTAS